MLNAIGPDAIAREYARMAPSEERPAELAALEQPFLPHLVMPSHHDVRSSDVLTRRLHGNLAAAAECGPSDFSQLLLVPGVGPRTVRALAMVAEVLHGAPYRFSDPARFSFAHGGKDRHPFPVPIRVYDETIAVLKSAVRKAKLGREDELGALKRLDDQSRRLERSATGPSVEALIAEERRELIRLSAAGASLDGNWRSQPARRRGPVSPFFSNFPLLYLTCYNANLTMLGHS